jgi:hypothetical protein
LKTHRDPVARFRQILEVNVYIRSPEDRNPANTGTFGLILSTFKFAAYCPILPFTILQTTSPCGLYHEKDKYGHNDDQRSDLSDGSHFSPSFFELKAVTASPPLT